MPAREGSCPQGNRLSFVQPLVLSVLLRCRSHQVASGPCWILSFILMQRQKAAWGPAPEGSAPSERGCHAGSRLSSGRRVVALTCQALPLTLTFDHYPATNLDSNSVRHTAA